MNQEELKKIKKEALSEHIPIIMDETLNTIQEIIGDKKLEKILEIGTAVGYSAICYTQFLTENGKIDTIEIDHERVQKANENIRKEEVDKKITILEGDALEVLPKLNEKYDMVFIDASKGKYPRFLEHAIRLSKVGTIILADNILYKGYVMGDYNKHKQRTAVRNLREYIKLITENPKLKTEILEVGDGLAVTRVESKM